MGEMDYLLLSPRDDGERGFGAATQAAYRDFT